MGRKLDRSGKALPAAVRKCRNKFLRYFPEGFRDETYIDWERGYKWNAHLRWQQELSESNFRALLREGRYADVAAIAIKIESRTNLLFSFEKMALRDAVKPADGAKLFAEGLHEFLFGPANDERRFTEWCDVVEQLPRRQTRVLTWPVVTVFGFIAQPHRHMFVKPNVTRVAARAYDFDLTYVSRPAWPTYASVLEFARRVCRDQKDLRPADLIDAQGFIWVQGSDEY
jgi:hypothetical protein